MGRVRRGMRDVPKIGSLAAMAAFADRSLRHRAGPPNRQRSAPTTRWDTPVRLLALHRDPIHDFHARVTLRGTGRNEILEQRSPDLHGYVWHICHPELRRSARNGDPSGAATQARRRPHPRPNPALAVLDVDALGYICMGFATLFGSFVFRNGGVDKLGKGLFHRHA